MLERTQQGETVLVIDGTLPVDSWRKHLWCGQDIGLPACVPAVCVCGSEAWREEDVCNRPCHIFPGSKNHRNSGSLKAAAQRPEASLCVGCVSVCDILCVSVCVCNCMCIYV